MRWAQDWAADSGPGRSSRTTPRRSPSHKPSRWNTLAGRSGTRPSRMLTKDSAMWDQALNGQCLKITAPASFWRRRLSLQWMSESATMQLIRLGPGRSGQRFLFGFLYSPPLNPLPTDPHPPKPPSWGGGGGSLCVNP